MPAKFKHGSVCALLPESPEFDLLQPGNVRGVDAQAQEDVADVRLQGEVVGADVQDGHYQTLLNLFVKSECC